MKFQTHCRVFFRNVRIYYRSISSDVVSVFEAAFLFSHRSAPRVFASFDAGGGQRRARVKIDCHLFDWPRFVTKMRLVGRLLIMPLSYAAVSAGVLVDRLWGTEGK